MNGGGWRWVLAAPCTENGGLDVFSVGCTTRWLKKTASVGGLDTVTLTMMSAHNHLQMRETGRLEIKLLSGVAQAQDGCKCCEAAHCVGQGDCGAPLSAMRAFSRTSNTESLSLRGRMNGVWVIGGGECWAQATCIELTDLTAAAMLSGCSTI